MMQNIFANVIRHVPAICSGIALIFVSCHLEPETVPQPKQEPQGDSTHTLRIVSPNGGESISRRDSISITVRCDTSLFQYRILVCLSVDGGLRWSAPLNEEESILLPHGDTTLTYAIPDSLYFPFYDPETASYTTEAVSTVSTDCVMEACDYDYRTNGICDISDCKFSITD
jgi:hypothetical protein